MLRKLRLVLFLLSSTQVDPNLFGIRDQFHKKHFLPQTCVWGGDGFRTDSSGLHLLCTLFLLLLHCNIQGNNYTTHHNVESVRALSLFSCS